MKIVEPSVELWKQGDDVNSHIAKCARICYASDKTTDNDAMVDRLIKSKHFSMLRHKTIYYRIPRKEDNEDYKLACKVFNIYNPYCTAYYDFTHLYVSINGQFYNDNKHVIECLDKYIVDEDIIDNIEEAREIMRYTFKVVTQIDTSRELNRVSPNNIAEQSTRYVYEDGSLCRPHWFSREEADMFNNGEVNKLDPAIGLYLTSCKRSFDDYIQLVKEYNIQRQDARGALPLDTRTVCAYTYSVKEWRNILDLRYYGTTGAPHPNAKIIASMIRDNLIDLGYEFRD